MQRITRCCAANMKWIFRFSVLLSYLLATERMVRAESCLSQPKKVIWQKMGSTAVIPCSISSNCSAINWQYEWFFFKENTPLRLKLHDGTSKYGLKGESLHISSLNTDDSGIYHCAAVSQGNPVRGSQYVGLGTTLVVTDKNKTMARSTLLCVSFILFFYCLVMMTLILKKYGCRKIKSTIKGNDSSKKKHFHDVMQEMCRRGKLQQKKETNGRNSSQLQASSTDLNGPADDIYQNV